MLINGRVFFGVLTVVVGLGLWVYFSQPRSYEECLVDGMRSQNQSMYLTVQELCARKHGRAEELWIPNYDVVWDYRDFTVTVVATRKGNAREDRSLTEATFQFSSKDCNDSKSDDFVVTKRVEASVDGNFHFLLPPSEVFSVPKCMKTISLVGKYR